MASLVIAACGYFLFLLSQSCDVHADASIGQVSGKTVEEEGRSAHPHIILIIADDLGFNDVGFHGSPQIPTPNLDALAFSGVILNSYYVSPICTPSRSALFTGKHPIHTGMQHNVIYGTTPYGLSLEEKLLPEYLKEYNYKTHLVGKWHLGHFRLCYSPLCRGFDSHFGHWTGHKDYYDNMAEESGPQAWGYDTRRDFQVSYDHFGEYTTDVYTEEAISIINNHKNKSKEGQGLFLTLSHTAVHSANPYKLLQAPQSVINKFSHIKDTARRTYAAMVSKLDDSVGSVVKALAENGMLNDTIIIFTTDNGGPAAGFNGNAASNWPLRGVKNTLWEGGVRGAAFVWSPRLKSVPRVSNDMMHIQDWLPTIILGALNETNGVVANQSLDGLNLWDTLNDIQVPSPRTKFLHNIDDIYGNEAVRQGNWKLLHGTTYDGKWDGWYGPSGFEPNSTKTISDTTDSVNMRMSDAGSAIMNLKNGMLQNDTLIDQLRLEAKVTCSMTTATTNNTMTRTKIKMPCNLKSGEYCLFNVNTDPCEQDNLAKEMPAMVKTLQDLLKQYKKSAIPPRNVKKDPRGQPLCWHYTWTNWMDFVEPIQHQNNNSTTTTENNSGVHFNHAAACHC